MLSGCATSSKSAAPLQRNIPSTCDQLARGVGVPTVNEGQDARVVAARHRAALVKANKRLEATRRCEAQLRQEYGR
jgi:hypothetical protein